MKQIGWAIGGVVFGFIVGGISPRMDVQDLIEERDALAEELAAAKKDVQQSSQPALPMSVMSSFFGNGNDNEFENTHNEEPDRASEEVIKPNANITIDRHDVQSRDDALDEFDFVVDAQRIRSEQSRAVLQDQADLTNAEMVELDQILEDMNLGLSDYAADIMALTFDDDDLDSAEMLGLTHEITGILYDAQSAIDDIVGDQGGDDIDPAARQIWNHIDLETFRPAVEQIPFEEE